MIWFNGYPFIDTKEEHTFGVPVSEVMTSSITVIPAAGLALNEVEQILSENRFQGYPIVEERGSKELVGYIGRTELRYAIDRAKRDEMVPPHALCFFAGLAGGQAATPSSAAPAVSFDTIAATSGQMSIDLSKFVDITPLSVDPRLALETVMEIFKKMGPRVILIEHLGELTGLVTVKDCLKYQFKVEAHVHPKADSGNEEREERLWRLMQKTVAWFRARLSWGRIQLQDGRSSAISAPWRTRWEHDSPSSAASHEPLRARNAYGDLDVELDDGPLSGNITSRNT